MGLQVFQDPFEEVDKLIQKEMEEKRKAKVDEANAVKTKAEQERVAKIRKAARSSNGASATASSC